MTAETITLADAANLIRTLAHRQSLLLLSPPGVGKSATVEAVAAAAGLPCRSLLGTQIAPEDVSGIPRIVGERSVFCPPRVLLPEEPEPFCLFLDELPACPPDIQKAFYSLLLERRLGEHRLPAGTWVVAAGNRVEDRAVVRSLSTALVNRVLILNVRVDYREWLQWASQNGIREDIRAFIHFMPTALMGEIPSVPVPFSTPRAWAQLSAALDLLEAEGQLTPSLKRAVAFGLLSPETAALFYAMEEIGVGVLPTVLEVIESPDKLPQEDTQRWFLLHTLRELVCRSPESLSHFSAGAINRFLLALPQEHRFALFVDRIEDWGRLGANEALLESLRQVLPA